MAGGRGGRSDGGACGHTRCRCLGHNGPLRHRGGDPRRRAIDHRWDASHEGAAHRRSGDSLKAMGGEIETPLNEGFPPVRVDGGGIDGGEVTIDARRSSQFASAVLMVAPYSRTGLTLGFVDDVIVSRPYVGTTLEVMTSFGAEGRWAGEASVRVEPGGFRGIDIRGRGRRLGGRHTLCRCRSHGRVVRVDGIPSGSTQADWVCSTCSRLWGAWSAAPVIDRGQRPGARGVAGGGRGYDPDAGRGAGACCRRRFRRPARARSGERARSGSRRPTGWRRSRPSCDGSAPERLPGQTY